MITLLAENTAGLPPSQSDLRTWADQFDLTHPVVEDPGYDVIGRYVDGASIALPSFTVLRPGAEIVMRDEAPTDLEVAGNLPDSYP